MDNVIAFPADHAAEDIQNAELIDAASAVYFQAAKALLAVLVTEINDRRPVDGAAIGRAMLDPRFAWSVAFVERGARWQGEFRLYLGDAEPFARIPIDGHSRGPDRSAN